MSVRSKDQLAVMLKLVEVNKQSLTRKNANIRQRVWQVITQKLNQMHGAEKDVDAWKRCYYFWRLNTGNNYERDLQRIIKNVADDDYFVINVADDEFTSDHESEGEVNFLDAKDHQEMRFHELITKHRAILQSTADDEPLKQRIWLNITDELNSIEGGLTLPIDGWKERVDWSKYGVRRGRKRKIQTSTTVAMEKPQTSQEAKNDAFDLNSTDTMDTQDATSYTQDYEALILEETEAYANANKAIAQRKAALKQESNIDANAAAGDSCDATSQIEDIDKLLDDYDYSDNNSNDDIEYADDIEADNECKSSGKRVRLTPIVKSFKLSNRITNAVEALQKDVKDTKQLLHEHTNVLQNMCKLLQTQCQKQDETNALLKRNTQLLKVLVEYKCGRRSNGK